jgi:hypothetical protein
MKSMRRFLVLLFFSAVIFSCKKEDGEKISLEGIVTDDISHQPIAGIEILADAIKSSTGWGILSDGKRASADRAVTDQNGHYKLTAKIFEGAERLEFQISETNMNRSYTYASEDLYLSNVNRSGNNKVDFELSPIARLKINFKNATPVSDSDFFYFGWYPVGGSGTVIGGSTQKEDCGTIPPSAAITWTGKDVCGAFTVQTLAGRYTRVYWTVKKGGVTTNFHDSVFINRGVLNQFSINY